jgi:hypothetical protein
MRSARASSHANWKSLRPIRGSHRRGSACQLGDLRQVKAACCLRVCCRRGENRSTQRSVHRKSDARQSGNVRPECHRSALCWENLLLPGPGHLAPGVLQELNSWPQNFAWASWLAFPSTRCRFRARFRPAEASSRNFQILRPSFRCSVLPSIPRAAWLGFRNCPFPLSSSRLRR